MFTAALVMSLATNVGLLFYIISNHALDKWEKKDATASTHWRRPYQRPTMVHRNQDGKE